MHFCIYIEEWQMMMICAVNVPNIKADYSVGTLLTLALT